MTVTVFARSYNMRYYDPRDAWYGRGGMRLHYST